MNGKEKRITVFGDSIGKGFFTEKGKLTRTKENAVTLFSEYYGVSVENRSMYGQSLSRVWERDLAGKYLAEIDKTKDNVAVIELGGNDADFDWAEVCARPEEDHRPKTEIGRFAERFGEIVDRFIAAGVRLYVCTIVPVSSKKYFANVVRRFGHEDAVMKFFRGDYNTISRHQEMFNNEILMTACGRRVPVIDLRRRFLDTNRFEEMICEDGIHPNKLGQREIFEAVKQSVGRPACRNAFFSS